MLSLWVKYLPPKHQGFVIISILRCILAFMEYWVLMPQHCSTFSWFLWQSWLHMTHFWRVAQRLWCSRQESLRSRLVQVKFQRIFKERMYDFQEGGPFIGAEAGFWVFFWYIVTLVIITPVSIHILFLLTHMWGNVQCKKKKKAIDLMSCFLRFSILLFLKFQGRVWATALSTTLIQRTQRKPSTR